MVQPMGGLPYATDVNSPGSVANPSSTASSDAQAVSGSDFANELASVIQNVINQSGGGSEYQIDIQTGSGADGGQFTITVTPDGLAAASSGSIGSAAPAGSAATSAPPVSNTLLSSIGVPLSDFNPAPAAAASSDPSSPASWTPPTFTAAQLATMTPADVYWAEQPPAVQQLRYMSMDQRGAYAEQLAAEGYTIDVPIMVDGGDPLAVMIQREEEGYTWVPSALQSNIPAGPGIDVPGAPEYNPNDPPAGSIMVSTAFALGTDLAADPVVSAQDAETYVQDQAGSNPSSTAAA